jgi:hypothetical protein
MKKRWDIKLALTLNAACAFALWLGSPSSVQSNTLSGLVIGLAFYCFIRLSSAER